MKKYHITKKNDHWSFFEQNSSKAIKNCTTKAEAISYMQNYMSNRIGSVIIHKENGQIQEERTYQRKDDPRTSKG